MKDRKTGSRPDHSYKKNPYSCFSCLNRGRVPYNAILNYIFKKKKTQLSSGAISEPYGLSGWGCRFGLRSLLVSSNKSDKWNKEVRIKKYIYCSLLSRWSPWAAYLQLHTRNVAKCKTTCFMRRTNKGHSLKKYQYAAAMMAHPSLPELPAKVLNTR